MAGEKGAPRIALDRLDRAPAEARRRHWVVLTGCRKGTVPQALVDRRSGRGAAAARRLVDRFGRTNVVVELWDHGDPLDSVRNDALAELADAGRRRRGGHQQRPLPPPARRRLATALAAVRARRQPRRDRRLVASGSTAHLRSGAEQARRFARYPGVVERAAELGLACAFDLALVAPEPAAVPVPRRLRRDVAGCGPWSRRGANRPLRAPRATSGSRGLMPSSTASSTSSTSSGSPATSWWCGTSSSSAVGRTSSARGGGRRPTLRSATRSASPTPTRSLSACCSSGSCRPNVTARPTSTSTSRATAARRSSSTSTNATAARTRPRSPTSSPTGRKSSIRDMAKALGYATGQQDAFSKQLDRWTSIGEQCGAVAAGGVADGLVADHAIPADVLELARRDRARPPPPRHPLGGHGHLRPAGDRGVPGRVGPHGRSQRLAVGQGRLCRGRAGEVRPARSGDAQRPALRDRPDRRAPRHRRSTWPPCPNRTRSTT